MAQLSSTGGAPFAFGNFIGGAAVGPPPPPVNTLPVPTLSDRALLALAALVVLAAALAVRRRG